MAYDSPFQVLTPEVVRLLSAEYNAGLRGMYIDCLAVLQGFLGRFSSTFVSSVFGDAAEVDSLIEGYLFKIPDLFARPPDSDIPTGSFDPLQAKANLLRDFMIETLRRNKETAIELYSECLSPKRGLTRQAAFDLVDNYLNALATQYRVLRYPNTQPQILQAGR